MLFFSEKNMNGVFGQSMTKSHRHLESLPLVCPHNTSNGYNQDYVLDFHLAFVIKLNQKWNYILKYQMEEMIVKYYIKF